MYMNLLELTKIIKTEKKAFKYLCKQKDRLNHKILCPFCKSDEYYLMDRTYLRCKKCRKDYNPFINTIFSRAEIGYRKWLLPIKLFEIETNARKASKELGISYHTTLKAFNLLR